MASTIDSKNWKCVIFDSLQKILLTRCQKGHLNKKSIWFSPLPLGNSINVAILIQIVLFMYLERVGKPNFWCIVKKISGSEKTVNCGEKFDGLCKRKFVHVAWCCVTLMKTYLTLQLLCKAKQKLSILVLRMKQFAWNQKHIQIRTICA